MMSALKMTEVNVESLKNYDINQIGTDTIFAVTPKQY